MTMSQRASYDLKGRVAVVTGAARGIGYATATQLAANGATVAALDLDVTDAENSPAAITLQCDIRDADSVRNAFEQVDKKFGNVQILVNNAGVNANFSAVAMSPEDWSTVVDTDLRGAWLCSQQALRPMMAAGAGSIVNITSIHARMTLAGFFPYGAAKAGLEGMTRSLAVDFGPHNIRVNAVAPGYTRTRLVAQWLEGQKGTAIDADRVNAVHPLRRIAEVDEVAAAVCFLASDDSSAITGASLAVDCGLSSRFAT